MTHLNSLVLFALGAMPCLITGQPIDSSAKDDSLARRAASGYNYAPPEGGKGCVIITEGSQDSSGKLDWSTMSTQPYCVEGDYAKPPDNNIRDDPSGNPTAGPDDLGDGKMWLVFGGLGYSAAGDTVHPTEVWSAKVGETVTDASKFLYKELQLPNPLKHSYDSQKWKDLLAKAAE